MTRPMALQPSVPGNCKQDMQQFHLYTEQNGHCQIGDRTERLARTPLPSIQEPSLAASRALTPFSHVGPIDPPISEASLHPALSLYNHSLEPIIGLTEPVWNPISVDIQKLVAQRQHLQRKVSELQYQAEMLLSEGHDLETQLSKLHFRIEANRDYRSDLGRFISLAEIGAKNLQMDTENLLTKLSETETELKRLGGMIGGFGNLQEIKRSIDEEHSPALSVMAPNLDRDAGSIQLATEKLEEQLQQVILEQDATLKAEIYASDNISRAQNSVVTIAQREQTITDLRQKYLEEQLKNAHLEDEVEELRAKINQEHIKDLEEKLREKTSICGQLRNRLRLTEQQLKISQERLLSTANNGELLRGGAHLVAPSTGGKLPKYVIACSECYANNLPCDSNVICRCCVERNTKCTRWRCSLKHRLDDCPMAPCDLLHDGQGWLTLQDSRPQW